MPAVHPSAQAVVRVAGTTSNLGPGFDCLGLALDLHNEVRVSLDGVSEAHEMADAAAALFFKTSGIASHPFRWEISGSVPVSRGLGSSVTLRLGILAGLNALHGLPLSLDDLFQECSRLEGHPDNAGPAVYGGFFVGGPNGSRFRFPVDPSLRAVLLIRRHEVRTEDARRVLPKEIALKDAVANTGYATAIAAAFASRNYLALKGLMRDTFHEPYREPLNPGLRRIVAAGEEAGALGGFLSGSGSTIACLTADPDAAPAIGQAMLAAACDDPLPPAIHLAAVDNTGVSWSQPSADAQA
jgi:homoserine kinase